jgi:hypothetical protein
MKTDWGDIYEKMVKEQLASNLNKIEEGKKKKKENFLWLWI